MINFLNQKRTLILVTSILLVGIFLRFWALTDRFVFAGDESYLIWEVWNLAQGHLPLVGFEAGGVGGIKLTPYLLYFLSIPFTIFKGHPLFIEITLGLLGAIRGVLFYLIGRNIFNEKIGILAASIYLLSERVNIIDRKFFGATFLILSSLLVLYLLAKIYKEKNVRIRNLIILGSVIGLSFSTHYQAAFLFLGSFIFILFFKKNTSLKQISIFIVSTLIWFAPLVLFELRHNFSITRRFLALAGSTTSSSFSGFTASAQYLLQQFYGILISPIYRNSLLDDLPFVAFWFSFLIIVVLISSLAKIKKYSNFKPLFSYFILMIVLAFFVLGFYQRPHYDIDPYYWFLIPIFIFMLALCFDFLFSKKGTVFLGILIFAVFAIYNLTIFFTQEIPDTYQTKTKVVNAILEDMKSKSLTTGVIRFEYGEAGAFDYLFYYQSKNKNINPENLKLISHEELFQQRVLLGGIQGPIKILEKTTIDRLTPNYLVTMEGDKFANFRQLAVIQPYSIQINDKAF